MHEGHVYCTFLFKLINWLAIGPISTLDRAWETPPCMITYPCTELYLAEKLVWVWLLLEGGEDYTTLAAFSGIMWTTS